MRKAALFIAYCRRDLGGECLAISLQWYAAQASSVPEHFSRRNVVPLGVRREGAIAIADDRTSPGDDYFTPEARKLCARVKHKAELTDDETLMLALAAAQAALAHYWHPGVRSAEETLQTIGAILDHEDGVGALNRKIELEERQKRLLRQRLDQ
jgi:hypothetical protein